MEKTGLNVEGFTLVELLIAVAIIGILASVAIQQVSGYRARANDTKALQQIRSMASAEEMYYIENNAYTTNLNDLKPYGFVQESDVTRSRTLIDKNGNPSTTAFQLTATHTKGSGKVYLWMSDNGGLQ